MKGYALPICGEHFHDHIISLRGEVWVPKTSLSSSLFIEVSVPACVRQKCTGIDLLLIFCDFSTGFLELFRRRGI